MVIFHYDPITHEYIGQSQADLDPLETELAGFDVFLIPRNATQIAPPPVVAKQVAVFESGAWGVVQDHRGETFYRKDTGEKIIIEVLGETDSFLTNRAPLTIYDIWNEDLGLWETDIVRQKEANAKNLLSSLDSVVTRGLEEVLYILESKSIMFKEELPSEIQNIIMQKELAREDLSSAKTRERINAA